MFAHIYAAILFALSQINGEFDDKFTREPSFKEYKDTKASIEEVQQGYIPGRLGFPPRIVRNPVSN